jgi:hypothetical protein
MCVAGAYVQKQWYKCFVVEQMFDCLSTDLSSGVHGR